MKPFFCCPVCGGALTPVLMETPPAQKASLPAAPAARQTTSASAGSGAPAALPAPPRVRTLRCAKGHSFDVAKEGYVHLLGADRMHTRAPGDSKEMVAARRAFLAGGYYAPFAQALCALLEQELAGHRTPLVLDAGCGDGYYTAAAARALPQASIAAFDVSKPAVRAAAVETRGLANVQCAVAGSFAIPILSETADAVCNIFSPAAPVEFARVLRRGGALIYAVPGPRHLFGLKEVLYDTPYENPLQDTAYAGFALEKRVPVRTVFTLRGEAIRQLFAMTPYYWKTPREGAERLAACSELTTEAAFDFVLYRRL